MTVISGRFSLVSTVSLSVWDIHTSSFCPKYKKSNDKLGEHAGNDGVPFDTFSVPRCGPQRRNEDGEAKQADGAIVTCVILAFWTGE